MFNVSLSVSMSMFIHEDNDGGGWGLVVQVVVLCRRLRCGGGWRPLLVMVVFEVCQPMT